MGRIHQKAWELLARAESEGDHRGAIIALREVRECLESLGKMLTKQRWQMVEEMAPNEGCRGIYRLG